MYQGSPPARHRLDELDDPVVPATGPSSSLTEDVKALAQDGRTYFETELAFQKTRASYSAQQGKAGAIHGAIAAACAHMAGVALVVGLLLALGSLIGPWWSLLAVTGVFGAAAAIFGLKAQGRFSRIAQAFSGDRA